MTSVGGLLADDRTAAAKRGARGSEICIAPAGKIGELRDGQKHDRTAQPPPAKCAQRQNAEQHKDKSAAQGSAPLVATNIQVGLAAPI